jgi:hypothetical protein
MNEANERGWFSHLRDPPTLLYLLSLADFHSIDTSQKPLCRQKKSQM